MISTVTVKKNNAGWRTEKYKELSTQQSETEDKIQEVMGNDLETLREAGMPTQGEGQDRN